MASPPPGYIPGEKSLSWVLTGAMTVFERCSVLGLGVQHVIDVLPSGAQAGEVLPKKLSKKGFRAEEIWQR